MAWRWPLARQLAKSRGLIGRLIAVALVAAGCTTVTIVVPTTPASRSPTTVTVPPSTPRATEDLTAGSPSPTAQLTFVPTSSPPGPTPGLIAGICAVRLERGDTVVVLHEPLEPDRASCNYLAENTHLAIGGNWSIAFDVPLADSLVCRGYFGNAAIPFDVWDSGDHHWGDLVCKAYR
ncbi:MAG: hypothetical protein IVW53_01665 [Chloroflexi bacterium]|nr:hypothetical protein [Chloroflexota bacterium]